MTRTSDCDTNERLGIQILIRWLRQGIRWLRQGIRRLRQISAIVGIYFFLYIPLAILGVPPEIIAVVAPLHLFAQFWYHTRLIGHMGFLEHIIVTPSHHRVHHAINEIYLDKNLSQVFIVWDKLFGTFRKNWRRRHRSTEH